MEKKIVSTDTAPKAIGPYSQAVIANGFAFLSGQIPLDPATNQLIEGRHRGADRAGYGESESRAGGLRIIAGGGGEDDGFFERYGRVCEDERGLWALFRRESAGSGDGGSGSAAQGCSGGNRVYRFGGVKVPRSLKNHLAVTACVLGKRHLTITVSFALAAGRTLRDASFL